MGLETVDIENIKSIGIIRKINKKTLKDKKEKDCKVVLFVPIKSDGKMKFILPVIDMCLFSPEVLSKHEVIDAHREFSINEMRINLGYPFENCSIVDIVNSANSSSNLCLNEYLSKKTLPNNAYIDLCKQIINVLQGKELSKDKINKLEQDYNERHLTQAEHEKCIPILKMYTQVLSSDDLSSLSYNIETAMNLNISSDMDEYFDDSTDSSKSVNLFVPFEEKVLKIDKINTVGVHRVVCVNTREDIEEPRALFVAKVINGNDIYFTSYKDVFDIVDDQDFYSNNDTFINFFDLEGFPHLYFITTNTLSKSQPFSKLSNEEIENLKIEMRDYIFNLEKEEIYKEKGKINNAIRKKITREASRAEKYSSLISTIVYFKEELND